MALSINSGPNVTTGNTDTGQNHVPEQGPSVEFQGGAVLDPRFVGNIGAALGTPVYAVYANPYFSVVDAVPAAASASRIASVASTVAGTALALNTAQAAGVTPNLPLTPLAAAGGQAQVTVPLTLDFGFTTANITGGANVLTIPAGAWKYFQAGQPVLVGGAGNAGGTAPLAATVTGPLTTGTNNIVPGTTTITLSVNAASTQTGAPVGNASPVNGGAWPYLKAGNTITLYDPSQGISRGTSVTGVASSPAQTFTVRGYDIYGVAMSETISHPGGAVVAYGKKAFKHIMSVTPSATAAFAYTIGTSDLYGLNVRSDLWEYLNVFVAGAFLVASTGWTVADPTIPATSTTGDARGTIQIGTLGPSGSGATGGPMDGVKRLAAFMSLPVYNAIGANNLNYTSMYGTQQA